jgi:hypothetical protein
MRKKAEKIASDFLKQHQFSEERIAKIGELILATDKFYKPKNQSGRSDKRCGSLSFGFG